MVGNRGRMSCRRPWPRIVGAVLALAVVAPLAAQTTSTPASPAQSMAISVTGMGGARSALTFTYPTDPGESVAAQDAKTLAQTGQWTVSTPTRALVQGGVFYEAEAAPAIAADANGEPPLFPFLMTFRRFPEIALVFIGATSSPQGSGSGGNRYLRAEWTRSGGVASYNVHLKDASFSSPADIVLTPGAAPPAPAPSGRRTGMLWVLLLFGSLGAGVFAWGLTWWLLSLRESRNRSAEEENEPSIANQPPAEAPEGPAGIVVPPDPPAQC